MELNRIIRQYREREQYYCWEVYHWLNRPGKAHYLTLLRLLACKPHKKIASDDVAREVGQPRLLVGHHLRFLHEHGLLVEIGRENNHPIFRLSDFGLALALCIPHDWKARGDISPDVIRDDMASIHGSHKRNEHYKWEEIDPFVVLWQSQGIAVKEIARRLHIPSTSLYGYLWRKARDSEALRSQNGSCCEAQVHDKINSPT